MNFILIAVIVLGAIALISAIVLYAVSKKFAVQEDPRIGQVVELLPGANCGGCGFHLTELHLSLQEALR